MEWLIMNWDTVLLGLTGLHTIASIVTKLTPTKADDAALVGISRLIALIALNKKN